ncbi:glycosyl transferase [Arcticibacter svalbardensis MN12-7]|uniref:Glycosyl transferase n=2 Tax=Arcticibacter TaxID=1288026 RepID=R9GQH7_9SPHI|nr:glycosyl transferase [Arcticibacter svalbardensis MN12-7]
MYPVEDYIYFGIHVKEQIDVLVKNNNVSAEIYFINGRGNKLNYLKSIYDIRVLLRENKFDLVHIHYGISGLFLLLLPLTIPVVITLHSGELYQKKSYLNHLAQKNLTLAVLKKVNKIIVLNDEMINLLKDRSADLIKVPCGTDLGLFMPKDRPLEQKFRIGFPGNKARKEKNFILFSSIIELIANYVEVEIVEFHNLTRAEVINNMNSVDVLLMTSTIEGSPQIIKEAMSCNRPILSTNVGDVSDLLLGVKNCVVIDSFVPQDFIEALKRIVDLPFYSRVSNGREKLQQMQLDSVSVGNRVYDVYEKLL